MHGEAKWKKFVAMAFIRYLCLLLLFSTLAFAAQAQVVKVYGKITNNKLEPLPNASVHLKTSSVGTLSKDDGSYELYVPKGTYEIVVSMLGYKSTILPVVVNDELLQNVILEDDEEKSTLQEVVIKVKLKDRADEIMRKLVDHKDSINNVVQSYSYKAYIKALQQDSTFSTGKESDSSKVTSRVVSLQEILLKVDQDA
ncbi:MAG TPA: carboxypeptidase-like regulatory domain-containing protein, partial [Flavisolibacter sp.]|nr:carboxypeptidase-like regulatory domain-containing protein [Flavisolibacter sp.]